MVSGDLARGLHLPDLAISGFRGIKRLTIEKLGRVTLLAGLNGAGKTTVLEAVRLYAGRGSAAVCELILEERGDVLPVASDEDDDREFQIPDYTRLFPWHTDPLENSASISIGPAGGGASLRMALREFLELPDGDGFSIPRYLRESEALALLVDLGNHRMAVPVPADSRFPYRSAARQRAYRAPQAFRTDDFPSRITCESLGPGTAGNRTLLGFWEKVALSPAEDQATEALRIVLGHGVERVAFIGGAGRMARGARPIVKLKGQEHPVPLQSLGDGAVRMFAAALALANCRDGFLLIDEAENGIHYRLQEDYWLMILRAATDNNVQVLATTHSWDCVRGFARAAAALDDTEGRAVRIEHRDEALRSVEYDEEMLETAADQRIEVR